MKLFKDREVKFISSECPGCGAKLEIDRLEGMAKCPYCGKECIIEKGNGGAVDSVLNFVERQQKKLHDKREAKRKIKEEKKQRNKERWKKYGWIYILVFVTIYVISLMTNR